MLEEIYLKANDIARGGVDVQVVGEKRDYYVTLQQLEAILTSFEKKVPPSNEVLDSMDRDAENGL